MRKTFSKVVSAVLSAAMVLSLGAGVAVNGSSVSAEDEVQVTEEQPTATEDETQEGTDVEGVTYGYSAYLGFQTDGPYAYRDPCMDKTNGLTNKDYKYETQCMLPVDKPEVAATDVTSVKQVMSAPGQYTVSISGIDLVNKANISKKGTVTKATCFNMLYVTTDIPLTNKNVKCTNVTLKIDGKELKTLSEAPCKTDAKGYYQFMIADNYADSFNADNGIYKTLADYVNTGIYCNIEDAKKEIVGDKNKLTILPTSSVEISYTIEGGDWSKLPLAGTIGMKFTDGDFIYKVTGSASATTAGAVQIVGLSDAGKTKATLEIPAVVKEDKLTKAEYKVSSIAASALRTAAAKTVCFEESAVTSLPSGVFKGATALTTVKLGAKIKKIPSSAFEGCKKLTTVKMSDAVSSIGSKAFSGCTSIKTFKVSKSTKSISSKAFEGCTALTSVTLGKSTKKIGSSAFTNCKKLSKLAVSQKVKVSKNAFKGCKKTIKVSGKAANKKYTVEQIKKSGYKKVK